MFNYRIVTYKDGNYYTWILKANSTYDAQAQVLQNMSDATIVNTVCYGRLIPEPPMNVIAIQPVTNIIKIDFKSKRRLT